ncbi:Phage major capsid protein [Enterococcus phage vB_EfaS_140]|uniref:Phage major capsid protein n=1 Tax=Enterococcus phage vB_EfaS_140 TaxID=2730536 RepID=A0ACA9AS76_9CAUD|nr:Phage major capsid protein [Enterococcus phage vB_EfaS_140]
MEINLKAMLEKRNALVQEMSEVADKVEAETRAFDESELSRISEIKSEVADLDASIKQIKEVRSLADADVETIGGETKMEKEITKEVELRGMEQFLRRREGEELRDIAYSNSENTTANNANPLGEFLVPTQIHNEIVELLGETSPVFEAARKFTSVTGNLKIAREDGNFDEGFIGETVDANKLQPKLKAVTLNQKRVGAAIQLTQQLINDSGVDIVSYAQGRLARSVAKTIERGILVGPKDGENEDEAFRPVIGDKNVLALDVAKAIDVPDLLNIYGTLNPGYLEGSMWVMSRPMFNKVMQLKDGDGTFLIFRGLVDGKPGYSLFGCPVHVSDVLTGENADKIVFGNFQAGYGMLIKKGMNLINVTQDTTQALAGGQLSILDTYMDGEVYNPNALVVATAK